MPSRLRDDALTERVQRFFGVGSGVEIVSRLGEGTCVTLRLCGAVAMLLQQGDDLVASETSEDSDG